MNRLGMILALALGLIGPLALPGLVNQLALLWLMVILALSWDLLGGQMGYNSFGNIVFFGIGAYAAIVIPRAFDLGYFPGLIAGLAGACGIAVAVALVLGSAILGMRGHYFAICTLGLSLAAGELAGAWDFIGAGSGLTPPQFPGSIGGRGQFFAYGFFVWAVFCFFSLRALYRGRFGLVLNAIRDDEDKVEAMGLATTRYKVATWAISAGFLGTAGGMTGYFLGYVDPHDVAFAGQTYGVWMVLMAILGGKGTLWGPVIGAVVFHITQELFWTYLLGWQRVALGLMIVGIVLFFPQGILGWFKARRHGGAAAS